MMIRTEGTPYAAKTIEKIYSPSRQTMTGSNSQISIGINRPRLNEYFHHPTSLNIGPIGTV